MSVDLVVKGYKTNGRGDVEVTIALLKDGDTAYQDVFNLSRAQARSRFAKAVEPLVEDGDDIEGRLLAVLEQVQGLAPEGRPQRYTARFPGLVDIVDVAGEPQFLVLEGNELRVCMDRHGQQPPPREQLPFLLPRADRVLAWYGQGEDPALLDDLMAYHADISQLPSEDHALLLAAWTAHTYLMERWAYSPVLCLYAVPERGKSRTGKGIASAAFRGIHSETLQEANLFRWSNDLAATLFLDVKDIWKKAEKRQSEDILLQRFEQGGIVGRVLYPERGPFLDTRYFEVFGPTVIATNEAVHRILDTRAITIIMPDADKDFSNPVVPEVGLALRERLITFRARYLNAELPTPPRLAQARLGDIVCPLATIVQITAPQHFDRFRALIRGIEADRLQDKAASFDGRLLGAMLELEPQMESGNLAVAAVTEKVNEGWPEKYQKSAESVGRKLRALGFTRARMTGGARAVEYDIAKVRRLAERYGLTVPLAEPSQLSQPSLADTNQPPDGKELSLELSPELSLPARYENDSSDSSDSFPTRREPENLKADKEDFSGLMAGKDFPGFTYVDPETGEPCTVAPGPRALADFLDAASESVMEAAWAALASDGRHYSDEHNEG